MVILVDTNDRPIGRSPKMDAHRSGLLHRAYSVLIFNSAGELLMQQRATDKYHSPGLWANTCCSHPLPGEDTRESAQRRLEYEMGISAELRYQTAFIYKSSVGKGLTEYEYDHIFTAITDTPPSPNRDEVAAFRYAPLIDILMDMDANAELYSAWFRIIFSKYYEQITEWAK